LLFHLLSKLYEQTIPDSTNRSAAYLEPVATGVDDTQYSDPKVGKTRSALSRRTA